MYTVYEYCKFIRRVSPRSSLTLYPMTDYCVALFELATYWAFLEAHNIRNLYAGIQLAEISTMPQSVITDAKNLAEKISEEKKVIAIFQAMKITSENRTCKS